jgi:hypothetical protein
VGCPNSIPVWRAAPDVGNYQSSLLALNAKTGKFVWQANTSTQEPFGKGGFYSSPAIAFGHVYAARDDGTVFAFDRKTGKVAWSFPTGGAVYGSPAVAQVPGTPPTVYIGSENGRLFALDARDGKERWHQDVGGPIPGTASVIGSAVFSSSFETRESVGYDVHTHKRDFTLHSAGYSPVVSDGHRLYRRRLLHLLRARRHPPEVARPDPPDRLHHQPGSLAGDVVATVGVGDVFGAELGRESILGAEPGMPGAVAGAEGEGVV